MDRRYIQLDPKKLDFLRLKRGWNVETLFEQADAAPTPVDKRTVKNIIDGKPAFVNNAKAVADLLGAEDLVSVLHPELLAEIGPPSGWDTPLEFFSAVGEWEARESLGTIQQTANGLRYDIWKMRHRYVEGRFGRGKCYDLNKLSTRERTQLKEHLTRHGEVCDRIGQHPNIAVNRTVAPWDHGAMWWIIDDWVDGQSLDTLIASESIAEEVIPTILRGVAAGLQAMHEEGIVRRELAPRHVLIRESDSAAILTDFELAKLTDGAPTVAPSDRWPDDDYRAVEVDSRTELDARADVYSWGRIAVHAICGNLPRQGADSEALAAAKLPASVRKIILSSVALPRSDRPASMSEVVAAIRKW